MEITDFGLEMLEKIGPKLIVYINTDPYCAKELILFPWQICPEHRHLHLTIFRGKKKLLDVDGEKFIYICLENQKKLKLEFLKKEKIILPAKKK